MLKTISYNPHINKDNLPSYPIPNFEETLNKFFKWVKPLASKEEYDKAFEEAEKMKHDKNIDKLNERFLELASREDDSYIFDYWVKFYLLVRDPLTPFTNVPIVYENKVIKDMSVSEKASALIYAISSIYLNQRLNPRYSYKVGKKTFSTDQFYGTLGAINHIKRDVDTYYINEGCSDNVVVLHKNNIYSIRVINDEVVIDFKTIKNTIDEIVKNTTTDITPNINHVTCEVDRDKAGDYLVQLLDNSDNALKYQLIKDAIFVLNLDSQVSIEVSIDELYRGCYDEKYFNRFHGKSTEFTITKDGTISFIIDHSYCDGGTEAYLMKRIREVLNEMNFEAMSSQDRMNNVNLADYERLDFAISDDMKDNLKISFEKYIEVMNSFTARHVKLKRLTRSGLKEKGILSGDGFIHTAFQVAQKMTYDTIYNTYISVDARTFFRGRTECNRPVTEESVRFVEELLNNKIENTSTEKLSNEELKNLLKDSLNAHFNRTKECQNGFGVNRYMYVLNQISNELNLNYEFFNTKAFSTLAENRLSTTSFGDEDIKYLYFPPVMKKGLGIYYMVSEESEIIITSFNEDEKYLDMFCENLNKAIDYMVEIL